MKHLSIVLLASTVVAFGTERLPEKDDGETGQHMNPINPALYTNCNGTIPVFQPGQSDFACPNARSPTRPTSVHQLRPGDINVIAALGDSLSAGNGALANHLFEVLVSYRGQAFSIGGDGNLTTQVTLPSRFDILRTFNRDLYGYSLGINDLDQHLNAAIEGSVCYDMPTQAQWLIDRMQSDKRVDMKNDWKLVTIFIGVNDLCNACNNTGLWTANVYAQKLKSATSLLFDALPRTIVQIVGIHRMELVRSIGRHVPRCLGMHMLALEECPCGADYDTVPDSFFAHLEGGYQQAAQLMMASGAFERDDFTLVVQPMLEQTTQAPLCPDGSQDLDNFAPDCFHFSQKLHGTLARYLWNTMLVPVASKWPVVNLTDSYAALNCPDPMCPYIRTTQNSVYCPPAVPMQQQ